MRLPAVVLTSLFILGQAGIVAAVSATQPQPTQPDAPRLSLLGTVTTGSRTKAIGVFRDETEKRVMCLRLGEEYNGWAVTQVQRTSVVLEKNGESVVLTLAPDTASPAPPAVTAPPQQPATSELPTTHRPKAPAPMPVAAFDWSAILKQGETGSSH